MPESGKKISAVAFKINRQCGVWFFCLALTALWGCATMTPPEKESGVSSVPVPEDMPRGEEGAESPDREEPNFAEVRPDITNRDELTVVFFSDPAELDFRKSYIASEAQLFTALYEGLFSYHPFTMEPVPAMAKSWKVSEDKKQWTFTLRDNARYWNGDPVTAEDFRSAWLSLLDPSRESPYSSLFDIIRGAKEYRLGLITDHAGVGIEAPDLKTLVVQLNAPASFFPSMLCHHSFSPIHPSMVNVSAWSLAPPVSNGPFYVAENQGQTLVLVKNPNYWDGEQVVLKKISFRYTQDRDEATALWNSGEARWISGEINFDTLTDRSGIMVNALFATHYYFIRSASSPWDDYRIRKALSLALPWEQLREGFYLPAKTLIYPIPGYPEVEGLETTDPGEAKRLLSEAGYPGGEGLPELRIRLTPSLDAARIGGLMAATWMQELGLKVKIDVVPYAQYFQSLKQNDYEVGFSTWIGDFADPYTFLQMWRQDSNLNDARFNDADYEALMERSMTEDGEKRWKTLAEAEKMLLDRGTVLPISYSSALNIVDTAELDGWFPNALDIHPFKYLAFKAYRPLPGIVLGTPPRP
ncbi:MAG: peptide ABC transporter substrate-binding protein [Spirochaetaceae bacterium]|jgi:peptide/nickel transport system substrate-binding protein/oligopeptide transport system substrate-binding protein|nr:peptide ABC transporter substrate-binding protein [Spirochaetaceae bacterium]